MEVRSIGRTIGFDPINGDSNSSPPAIIQNHKKYIVFVILLVYSLIGKISDSDSDVLRSNRSRLAKKNLLTEQKI